MKFLNAACLSINCDTLPSCMPGAILARVTGSVRLPIKSKTGCNLHAGPLKWVFTALGGYPAHLEAGYCPVLSQMV